MSFSQPLDLISDDDDDDALGDGYSLPNTAARRLSSEEEDQQNVARITKQDSNDEVIEVWSDGIEDHGAKDLSSLKTPSQATAHHASSGSTSQSKRTKKWWASYGEAESALRDDPGFVKLPGTGRLYQWLYRMACQYEQYEKDPATASIVPEQFEALSKIIPAFRDRRAMCQAGKWKPFRMKKPSSNRSKRQNSNGNEVFNEDINFPESTTCQNPFNQNLGDALSLFARRLVEQGQRNKNMGDFYQGKRCIGLLEQVLSTTTAIASADQAKTSLRGMTNQGTQLYTSFEMFFCTGEFPE